MCKDIKKNIAYNNAIVRTVCAGRYDDEGACCIGVFGRLKSLFQLIDLSAGIANGFALSAYGVCI